jgi:hypothetical protein
MKSGDELREKARARAKRYYEAHKEQLQAKNLANYHTSRKEMQNHLIEILSERHKKQLYQAKTYGLAVEFSREYKYRECPHCLHYIDLLYRQMITPTGSLIQRTYCPGCKQSSDKVEYQLT